LNALIGTMTILVFANILHFYAVSFLTATTALRQLDAHYEEASETLSVPLTRLFFRVIAPVCSPALLEIAGYLFVSSMGTVSAVIFLYSPDTLPASVAVVNMDEAGDTAPAAAMCMLIVLANVVVRTTLELAAAYLSKRKSAAPLAEPPSLAAASTEA
jgi:iron(III) transport system permease protein